MAAFKIENFDGERPSVSGQALPGTASQMSRNLFAAINEFRPLRNDKTVVNSASAGARSVYRMQRRPTGDLFNDQANETDAASWIFSADERSYVRSQINPQNDSVPAPAPKEGETAIAFTPDDERTYFSTDYTTDGRIVPPMVFDRSCINTPRKLGVPGPKTPTAKVVAVDSKYTLGDAQKSSKEVADKIAVMVLESAHQLEEGAITRYWMEGATLKTRGGPADTHGMVTTASIAQYLPEQHRTAHGVLWYVCPKATLEARLGAENLATVWVHPVGASGENWAVPLACLPYTLIPNKSDPTNAAKTMLEVKIATLKNPTATALDLFTPEQAKKMADAMIERSLIDNQAKALRDKLTQLANSFVADLSGSSYSGVPGTYGALPDMQPTPGATTTTDTSAAAKRELAAKIHGWQLASEDAKKQIEERVMKTWNDEVHNAESIDRVFLSSMGLDKLFGVTKGFDPDRIIETRFYSATFVTDWGEESAPSLPTELLEPSQYDRVDVELDVTSTANAGETPASRHIIAWRLYRSAESGNSAASQLVKEFPIATTKFEDKLKSEELVESMASTFWLPPPEKLRGLVGMANGIMAGFYDNVVCFSEPYHPYAWPVEYQITTEYPIVGLTSFGQTLFVGTTGQPYLISGSDSASMSAQKVSVNQACVSRRSITPVSGGGAVYVSPDGLCAVDNNGVKVITKGFFTREDWQLLKPQSMVTIEHEGIVYIGYVGTGNTSSVRSTGKNIGEGQGTYAIDIESGKLVSVDMGGGVSTFFVDRSNDNAYALIYSGSVNGKLVRMFGGSEPRQAVWRTGRNAIPQHAPFAWMQVEGFQNADNPVYIRHYGDRYRIGSRGDILEPFQVPETATDAGWALRRRSDGATFIALVGGGYRIDNSAGNSMPSGGTITAASTGAEKALFDSIDFTVVITDSAPVRLPPGRWRDQEIEIFSAARITRLTMAGSTEELKKI